jgi:tripartite-type tricarboxylate transporter receptor subunit TctC
MARVAVIVLAVFTVLSPAVLCEAASFPTKPITLIVPYPPGGVSDLMTRPLAREANTSLPHPIVIVNRPGGAGTIGFAEAIQSRPDGHTIGLGSVGISAIQPHLSDLPYKTPDDYQPLLNVITTPEIFAVRADAPWKSMRELLAYAKANPGKLRVSIPGVGSIQHMLFESLRDAAGVDMLGVPFSGGGEAIPPLLGGHVEAIVIAPAPVIGHIQAGKIRVLATFSEQRDPFAPDTPSIRELGYEVSRDEYVFLAVPKETSASVAQLLHDTVKKAMASESFQKFTAEKQLIIRYETGADLKKRLQADYAYYGDLIKKKQIGPSK